MSGSDEHRSEHRRTDRREVLGLLGAIGAATVAGCSSEAGNTKNQQNQQGAPQSENQQNQQDALPAEKRPIGGTFINGSTAPARGLSPLNNDDGPTLSRLVPLYDGGMYRKGPKYDDQRPMWFESWDINDSLDVVDVKLRPNLRYSDKWGQLTAEDFIYNIENIFTSDWFPYSWESKFSVSNKKGKSVPVKYEKTGKLTIREELPTSRPFWPYTDPLTYVLPVPKRLAKPYVKKQDAKGLRRDPAVYESKIEGNLGPYDLKKWNRDSVVIYSRADDYYLRKWAEDDPRLDDLWSHAPYFNEYQIQLFNNNSTMRNAFKSGAIDATGISSKKINAFKRRDDTYIFENPYVGFANYFGMNHRANGWSQLRNKKVRWAIANLYNRKFVCNSLHNGKYLPMGTLYPKWGKYYPKNGKGIKSFEWTIEKAKQLLKEGTSSDYGYDGGKLLGPDGEQVETTLVYLGGSPMEQTESKYFQRRARKAGIKVNLKTTNWTALVKNYAHSTTRAKGVPKDENIGYGPKGKEHPSKWNYGPGDKAVSSNQWDFMNSLGTNIGQLDPAGTIASVLAEKGTYNHWGTVPNKPIDKLRDQAKSANSIKEATEALQTILTSVSQDQPLVFESNPYSYVAYNDDLAGLPDSPAASYWVDQNWDFMYYEQK